MKTLLITLLLLLPVGTFAQWGGIIHQIGGGGTSTADGIPATEANLSGYSVVGVDATGNVYLSSSSMNLVKKIDAATGLIHSIAGVGGSSIEPSGDGGPATNAVLGSPDGVSIDIQGNIYISYYERLISSTGSVYSGVRKVDATTGIISIVTTEPTNKAVAIDPSGNLYLCGENSGGMTRRYVKKLTLSTGTLSLFASSDTVDLTGGDGGPATNAWLPALDGVLVDHSGNMYIRSFNGKTIKKVDAVTGIISTVAGNGSGGCSGDGGPASAAAISENGCVVDATGNIIIFPDYTFPECNTTRKVDVNTGIITIVHTVGANTPVSGLVIDSTSARPGGMYDATYHLYFIYGGIVWKMDPPNPAFTADSFSVYVVSDCINTHFAFGTSHYHSGMTVKTYFGDTSSLVSAVTGSVSGGGSVLFTHAYALPGNYIVKNVLYIGTAAVDSETYSYHFAFCNELSPRFYYDVNANCTYDTGTDIAEPQPVLAEIAINAVPVDTISSTFGFYYKAYGSLGDVVSIRIISSSPGLVPSCPASGIIYDTLQAGTLIHPPHMLGMNCASTPGFDLQTFPALRAGSNNVLVDIIVDNTYCNMQDGVVTMNISPKYGYLSAFPPPASVSGQTIKWNVTSLFAGEAQTRIHVTFSRTSTTPYLPGDTLITTYTIDPIAGDAIPASNYVVRVDTVKSGFDPNYITVNPDGFIPSNTLLEYAIGFENTGNDTAHNITVLDTLSEHLNMSTLRMLAASATMNISTEPYGEKTIVKFDFPAINLQDSTHHDQCNGLVVYNIRVKDNLLAGTTIPNRAGIYFDTNPVVMTNTVTNIIGWPTGIPSVTKDNPVELYPNPATTELTIKTIENSYSSVTITSSIGNAVMRQEITGSSTRLNISDLAPGIYYVSMRGAGGIRTARFVKL